VGASARSCLTHPRTSPNRAQTEGTSPMRSRQKTTSGFRSSATWLCRRRLLRLLPSRRCSPPQNLRRIVQSLFSFGLCLGGFCRGSAGCGVADEEGVLCFHPEQVCYGLAGWRRRWCMGDQGRIALSRSPEWLRCVFLGGAC